MTPRALLVKEFAKALDAYELAAEETGRERADHRAVGGDPRHPEIKKLEDATERARGEVEACFFRALAYQERA